MRSWMRDSLRRPSPAEEFEREVLSWLGEVVDVPQASGAWAISGWHNEVPFTKPLGATARSALRRA